MILCKNHEYENEQRSRLCIECEGEREQERRDRRHADQETQRMRDRIALQFALMIWDSQPRRWSWEEVAADAYAAADAMLERRAVKP